MRKLHTPRIRLTYANVMSTLGVFIALGGTSYAVTQLPKNSVGEKQLRTGAVTSAKVQDGTITGADLAPSAVARGPRGPRGQAGPSGADGATGAAGAPGAAGASAAPEAWKPLPLTAGWTSSVNVFGGSLQPVQYRKDAFGRVELRGMATYAAGDPATAGVFATLPAGYRPSAIRAFTVVSGGGSTNAAAQVNINPDGTMHRIYGVAYAEPDFLIIDGIVFETD